MTSRVLITGGAGFIGAHLADRLLGQGYRVRVLDNLVPQVYGPSGKPPSYLPSDVEFVRGDVRESSDVASALGGVDYVVHLAALVGVGQSMYQVAEHVDDNVRGTGVLLAELTKQPVKKLIVASSMSVHGDGACVNVGRHPADARSRSLAQLEAGVRELEEESGAPLGSHGVWSNEPVPLFPYPGSPQYRLKWGGLSDDAWERAHSHYLEACSAFSGVNDDQGAPHVLASRRRALGDLSRARYVWLGKVRAER